MITSPNHRARWMRLYGGKYMCSVYHSAWHVTTVFRKVRYYQVIRTQSIKRFMGSSTQSIGWKKECPIVGEIRKGFKKQKPLTLNLLKNLIRLAALTFFKKIFENWDSVKKLYKPIQLVSDGWNAWDEFTICVYMSISAIVRNMKRLVKNKCR